MSDPGSPRLPSDLDRLLHDLRGPLNAARMHLEVVRRAPPGDPAATQSLETVQDALARFATMLPVAFAVAALERGPETRVSLRALAEAAARDAGAPVTVAAGPWGDVVGDEALLTQAITHVLHNAVIAGGTPPVRPSDVAVERTNDALTLIVRDWGPPLPSTNPKVLIRLNPSPGPAHRGANLLAVERIVRLHGGTLEFRSAEGAVEVRLTLPAAAGR